MQGVKAVIFDWGRTLYDKENGILFPETKEVLEYCGRKYKLAIVSLAVDGDIEGRFRLLKRHGIRNHFQLALFHANDKDSLFRIAIGNLGLQSHEVAIVDDRIRRVGWPIKRGCKVIWIQKGKFADELPDENTGQPTATVKSLREVLNIL